MMKKTLKKFSLLALTGSLAIILTACNDDEPINPTTNNPDSLTLENPNVTSGIGGGVGGTGGSSGSGSNSAVKRGENIELSITVFAGIDESALYQSMKYLGSQDAENFNKLRNSGDVFELKRGTMVTVLATYGDIAEVQIISTRKTCFVPINTLVPQTEIKTETTKEDSKNKDK